MGLILAYFSFRYKLPLAVRSGLYPLLKDKINGPIGNIVDVFTLVSTFFGIATSLGLGVMQLNAGLVHLGVLHPGHEQHCNQEQTQFPALAECLLGILLAVISMSLLYAGGIQSLQTMTLISALPFGLIMLLLCFCLMKALSADKKYREAKIPYGSRNWKFPTTRSGFPLWGDR